MRGVALYERALALAPRFPDALYNLGVACSEAGQPERAVHLYELAVHFQPACAEAWNNLGVLQRSAGNLERAVACYRAALQLRPAFPQALNNLAVVLTAQASCPPAWHDFSVRACRACLGCTGRRSQSHPALDPVRINISRVPQMPDTYTVTK